MTEANESGKWRPHSAHWGVFSASWRDGRLAVRPHPGDPDPNQLIQNFPSALRHSARIAQPFVRRGWLQRGPGADVRRGRDEFVPVTWDRVLDLLAAELTRVRDKHGLAAIFGGSYGWASAGRFHHAQSQLHRFLNTALGGYVRSVNSYSSGASEVILPHILGPLASITYRNVTWEQVVAHSDVVVAFGGMALKNSASAYNGTSRHIERGAMHAAHERGARFVLVSPMRDDFPANVAARWLSVIPNTDTALMLGLAHTLATEKLHDQAFLDQFCVGYPLFEEYLLGRSDGQPKSAAWASAICGIPADEITALAHSLVGRRVLIAVSLSLQRAEHGEQPVWMAVVLAAMLGQIGLPGGGYTYGLGASANFGRRQIAVPLPALPLGRNQISDFIPVARIADMLLNPGAPFDYNGQSLTYPSIRLVYWAGGNPFHHHQDLNRLRTAFAQIETLVVHESAWTGTAKHADIVLPCTMTLERDDISASPTDPLLVAMHRIVEPFGEARDDYAIFSGLAARLGKVKEFTEGRDAVGWLRHLYARTQMALTERGLVAPDFDGFWQLGELELPMDPDDGGMLAAFRTDRKAHPLSTPSGLIEVTSKTIVDFGYPDCPGHPAWLEPADVPDKHHTLRLVANQPATRLHSQLDFGGHSQAAKHRGREVARMHKADAEARGVGDGDIIRLFNDRGACLAAVSLTENIRRGVVHLPTGAWYDPADPLDDAPLCVHGNPNVLTRDVGTSRLAQGCTGQITTVEVERFDGNLPPIRAYDPPEGAAIIIMEEGRSA